jgi:hypothetical protein
MKDKFNTGSKIHFKVDTEAGTLCGIETGNAHTEVEHVTCLRCLKMIERHGVPEEEEECCDDRYEYGDGFYQDNWKPVLIAAAVLVFFVWMSLRGG